MAHKKTIISICEGCTTCANCDEDLRTELNALRNDYSDSVMIVEVDCLDLCDFSPAAVVDGVSISPANADKLRKAVEKSLKS